MRPIATKQIKQEKEIIHNIFSHKVNLTFNKSKNQEVQRHT